MSYSGNAQQVDTAAVYAPDPTTFMLNDSTVCTSVENVIRTANEIKMLKAQRDFLREGLAYETVDKKEIKHTLRSVRWQIFWAEFKTPFIAVGSAAVGYGVGVVTSKR